VAHDGIRVVVVPGLEAGRRRETLAVMVAGTVDGPTAFDDQLEERRRQAHVQLCDLRVLGALAYLERALLRVVSLAVTRLAVEDVQVRAVTHDDEVVRALDDADRERGCHAGLGRETPLHLLPETEAAVFAV